MEERHRPKHPVIDVRISSVHAFRLLIRLAVVEARTDPCVCIDCHEGYLCCRDIDATGVVMSRGELLCDVRSPRPAVDQVRLTVPLTPTPLATVCVCTQPLTDFLLKTPNTRLLRMSQDIRGGVVVFEHEDPATSCVSVLELSDGLGGVPMPYQRGLPLLPSMTFDHIFRCNTKRMKTFMSRSRKLKADKICFKIPPPSSAGTIVVSLVGDIGVYEEYVERHQVASNTKSKDLQDNLVVSIPLVYVQQFLRVLTNDTHVEVYLAPNNPVVLSVNLGHATKHSFVRHMIAPDCAPVK